MKKALQEQNQRKYASKVILIFLLMVFTNCGRPADDPYGFTLQEFKVIDPQFKSLIDGIRDSATIVDRREIYYQESIPIMELRKNDSILEFGFASAGKDNLSEMYIFMDNKRIVGYLNIEKDTFIVLSNVVSQFDFYNTFYRYVIPTGNRQQFDYVYFPDDLYCVPDEKGFTAPPMLFDPHYYWYTYKDGKYIYQGDYHYQKE